MEKTIAKSAGKEAQKQPAEGKTQHISDRKETMAQERERQETQAGHTDWEMTQAEEIREREDAQTSPKKLNR
jgi:hypothetical protein